MFQDGWRVGFLAILAPKPERSVCGMLCPSYAAGIRIYGLVVGILTASDESLCRFFILMINEERRKRNLPTSDLISRIVGNQPKHGEKRRGERNRRVSWLAVEAHDIKSCGVCRTGRDGERSRLSKARREIAAFEAPLKAAIDFAKQHTPEEKREAFGETLHARFIRENFLQRFASQLQKQ